MAWWWSIPGWLMAAQARTLPIQQKNIFLNIIQNMQKENGQNIFLQIFICDIVFAYF